MEAEVNWVEVGPAGWNWMELGGGWCTVYQYSSSNKSEVTTNGSYKL